MTRDTMTTIDKQVFENAKSIGSHRMIEGLDLRRCEFIGSTLSNFDDPELNLLVRNVKVTRCVSKWSFLNGVRLEDMVVDGLTTSRFLYLEGCALKHLTLRGRIGTVMFLPPNTGLPEEVQKAFIESIVRYYQEVDWAVDISEAEFTSVNFFFVPGDLVRRDPETQYLLRRDKLEGVDLGGLSSRARIEVSRFESTPFDSIVAIAPKREKKFAETKAALDQLRDLGLAE